MRYFRLFLTWKKYDPNSTYQSLRNTLDKYSIFCGRNPVSYWLKLVERTTFECFCDIFTCRYQWWLMLAAVRQEEHPLEWRTRAPSEHPLVQVCSVAMVMVVVLIRNTHQSKVSKHRWLLWVQQVIECVLQLIMRFWTGSVLPLF